MLISDKSTVLCRICKMFNELFRVEVKLYDYNWESNQVILNINDLKKFVKNFMRIIC